MKPSLSCVNCRLRKKKCDRAFPACSYCLKYDSIQKRPPQVILIIPRTHDRCIYRPVRNISRPSMSVRIERTDSSDGSQRSKEIHSKSLFLDSGFLYRADTSATCPPPVDPNLRQCLEKYSSHEQYLTRFTDIFESFLSIVPYRDVRGIYSRPIALLDGEQITVFACICLHATIPLEEDPRTPLYMTIKTSLVVAEIHGPLSLKLLQAQTLVLLYEFGHGIYPSAFFTLGYCIRYLAALEITAATTETGYPGTWLDVESRRRLWWAIFVMERHVQCNRTHRVKH
jgi:hypothetical protein